MRFLSRLLVLSAVGGAAVFAGTTAFTGATSARADDPRPAETQPPIEENYDYPFADKIFAERGIRLIKGDGRILLVDCGGPDLVEVLSRSKGKFCFQVKGTRGGYVTMELPETYLIKGDSHPIAAKVIVDGETEIVPVNKNEWVPVGEGTDPNSGPATLLEIRASASA